MPMTRHLVITLALVAGCAVEVEPVPPQLRGGAGGRAAPVGGGSAGAAGSKAPSTPLACLVPDELSGQRWAACTLSRYYDPAAQRLRCVTVRLDFALGCIRSDANEAGWLEYTPSVGAAHGMWEGMPTLSWSDGVLTQQDCGSDPEAERQLEPGWCPAG